ncbi:B-(1-6) glucan synthase [Thozetella sp. PMI_491]|nr:B-(1-6) glucan synthase [Thozetella sp. PMI_491]
MRRIRLYFAVSTALAAAIQPTPCFPYGSLTLPKDLSKPSTALKDWWCPQSMAYGFQGFAYPLENSDCSAKSNGYDAMNKDFAKMKADFGATLVRMYYPACTQTSVFENAIKAAVANNMAVIFQVYTNLGRDETTWKKSQQAIYDVMNSKTYGPIAPYVVHSADFGSEPVTDYMDGSRVGNGEQFVADLKSFRTKMNGYGVKAGISESWHIGGVMAASNYVGLGPLGKSVKANSDYVHDHIMPYYHPEVTAAQSWAWIKERIEWVNKTVGLPVMITETQWAWGANTHMPNRPDVGVSQYTKFWKAWDDNCEYLKTKNVGWFLHTWHGETTFDILKDDGTYVIPSWKPRKC